MTELIFLWFTSPSLCISPLTIQQKLTQGHRSLPIKSSCLRELVTPSLFLPPLLLVSLSPSLLQVLWHWNILVPLDAEHSAKKSICFGEICLNPIDFWKIDLTLFLSAYKTSCLIFFYWCYKVSLFKYNSHYFSLKYCFSHMFFIDWYCKIPSILPDQILGDVSDYFVPFVL